MYKYVLQQILNNKMYYNKYGIANLSWRGNPKTLIEWRGEDDAFVNVSNEHFGGIPEDEVDFDIDHIVEFLLGDGRSQMGLYLPEEILKLMKQRCPESERLLMGQIDYMMKNQKIEL